MGRSLARVAWAGAGTTFLALAAQCVVGSHESGINVSLAIAHDAHVTGASAADGAPRTVIANTGTVFTITRGWVVLSREEITPCTAAKPGAVDGWRVGWGGWPPEGSAWAHSPGAPTVLGVPHVDDLLRADDQPVEMGTIGPPPGRYCGVRVQLAPADADAEGLPRDVDVVGRTLFVEGSYEPAGGTPETFSAVSSSVSSMDVLLEEAGGPVVLDVTTGPTEVQVVLAMAYDEWFDDLDPRGLTPAELGDRILLNVAVSLHVHSARAARSL